MMLAGWTLAEIAPVFAAGAVAITALYLLRMRRRQVVVPFAALWQRVTRESDTRRLWKRLRRLLSWLLQIGLLALLCAALGDPRPDSWLRDPRIDAAFQIGPGRVQPCPRLGQPGLQVLPGLLLLGTCGLPPPPVLDLGVTPFGQESWVRLQPVPPVRDPGEGHCQQPPDLLQASVGPLLGLGRACLRLIIVMQSLFDPPQPSRARLSLGSH